MLTHFSLPHDTLNQPRTKNINDNESVMKCKKISIKCEQINGNTLSLILQKSKILRTFQIKNYESTLDLLM